MKILFKIHAIITGYNAARLAKLQQKLYEELKRAEENQLLIKSPHINLFARAILPTDEAAIRLINKYNRRIMAKFPEAAPSLIYISRCKDGWLLGKFPMPRRGEMLLNDEITVRVIGDLIRSYVRLAVKGISPKNQNHLLVS